PAALGEVTEVPVPLDPLTGKPFVYRLAGGKATLYGPPPAGEQPGPSNSLSYELTWHGDPTSLTTHPARNPLMTRALTAACLLLRAALPARADEDTFAPTRLTLRPAAAPSPALRYRLLPDLREQKPGDAAVLYRRAVPLLQRVGADGSEQMAEWQKMPLGDL